MFVSMYACITVSVYLYVCACTYECMYECMFVRMYQGYACAHIHYYFYNLYANLKEMCCAATRQLRMWEQTIRANDIQTTS